MSAALFRNMDLALCLNVFGCLACFQGWHQAREERRRARHGVTYPKVGCDVPLPTAPFKQGIIVKRDCLSIL